MSGCVKAGSRIDGVFFWNLEFGIWEFGHIERAFERVRSMCWTHKNLVDIGLVLILGKGWNLDEKFVCMYDTILAGLVDWFMNRLMHKSFGSLHLESLLL